MRIHLAVLVSLLALPVLPALHAAGSRENAGAPGERAEREAEAAREGRERDRASAPKSGPDVYAPHRAAPRPRAPLHSGTVPRPLVECIPCGTLTWALEPSVMPAGVEGSMAGVIGTNLYVSHGYSFGEVSLLRIFDTVGGTWSLGPAGSIPRTEGMGAAIGTKLFAVGGRPVQDALEIFDTVTNLWTTGPSMPTPRSGAGAANLNGLLHIVGGRTGFTPETGLPLDAHEVFDPVTNLWSSRAPLPVPMGDCYATVVIGSKLYVFGGWDGSGPRADTQIYDDVTNTWSTGAPMPTLRDNAMAGVLAGRPIVIGGYNFANLNVTEVYDPASNTWCMGPTKPTPVSELAVSASYTSSTIYCAGSGIFGLSQSTHEGLVLTGGSDSTPPVLTCPADLVLECPPDTTVISGWRASASAVDDCDPNPVVTSLVTTHVPGCGGTYVDTYEFSAVDAAGNRSTCTRTLTVIDTTDPTITGVPPDQTVECDAVPPPATPTVSDTCDPAPTITFQETRSNGSCPNEYTLTRTWTASDDCGNTTSSAQQIVVRDTLPPVLSGVPADVTVECDAVPAPATPTATDNCPPPPAITFVESRQDGSCPNNYVLIRTWTATDACGHAVSATQRVTVRDTVPPVLSGVPPDVTVECDAVPPPATPTATDNCAPPPAITFVQTRQDGSCPDSYVLVRTWTATDACGHVVSATQRVTVRDTVPPVLSGVPADVTVECDAVPPPASPTATDNCSPPPAVTFQETRIDGSCPGEYVLVRTWHAQDRCGNVIDATQRVTVHDTTPPVLAGCMLEPAAPAPPTSPSSPRSPQAPASPASCGTAAPFRVRCGAATDTCSEPVLLQAEIHVRRIDIVNGACVEVVEDIPVACDDLVLLRRVAPPCPARPPRSPRSDTSEPPAIEGVEVSLRVRATDACGNVSAPCTALPDLPACPAEPGCCTLTPP